VRHNSLFFSLVIAVFLCGFAPLRELHAADEAAKKELAKLQGTWKAAALTYNGKDYFADGKAGFQFVIKDDVILVEGNDEVKKEYARIRIKVDPSATPKTMDLSVTSGVQKDAVIEGIYELKDDELRLCVKVPGKDRPTEFASPEGSSIALLTLKREGK
jgi:uncharacterized protein (TIGR03067 family)